MAKRKDDDTPESPGGRAAERLRQFEQARRPQEPDKEDNEKEACEKRASDEGQLSNDPSSPCTGGASDERSKGCPN